MAEASVQQDQVLDFEESVKIRHHETQLFGSRIRPMNQELMVDIIENAGRNSDHIRQKHGLVRSAYGGWIFIG